MNDISKVESEKKMDTAEFKALIENLGLTFQDLIEKKILSCPPPTSLYDDTNTLEVDLMQGMELVFNKESSRLEMIHFSVDQKKTNSFSYFERLPEPLNKLTNQAVSKELLGRPIHSATKEELFGTDIYSWDTFQLKQEIHPEAFLDIQYDELKNTKYLSVSLMNSQP
ncbi:hypothetical protein IFR09_22775 [Pseudomonas syringae]|nr:hypothetical protein [Pseudomonas syringae]MBD8803174.1 hypothetical protein [Pseudomonas syringae]MBD8813994.1 hypothetical protein [Pseudomonas syringae]